MKLIKIINARAVLSNFIDTQNIGAHLSYWMTKFIIKTDIDAEFYETNYDKIVKEFSIKTEKGELIVPEEKVEEFSKKVIELQQTEVEDPGIRFDLSELSKDLKMSMRLMINLLDFVDEDK